MPKTPRVKGKELSAALRRGGFAVMRIKGRHHFLRHSDGRTTVVPVHAGEVIGPGLMGKIMADCEMTVEELDLLL